jgi:hypothetical protein
MTDDSGHARLVGVLGRDGSVLVRSFVVREMLVDLLNLLSEEFSNGCYDVLHFLIL